MNNRQYELRILIGPCTHKEATDFLEDIANDYQDRLGAAYSMESETMTVEEMVAHKQELSST